MTATNVGPLQRAPAPATAVALGQCLRTPAEQKHACRGSLNAGGKAKGWQLWSLVVVGFVVVVAVACRGRLGNWSSSTFVSVLCIRAAASPCICQTRRLVPWSFCPVVVFLFFVVPCSLCLGSLVAWLLRFVGPSPRAMFRAGRRLSKSCLIKPR